MVNSFFIMISGRQSRNGIFGTRPGDVKWVCGEPLLAIDPAIHRRRHKLGQWNASFADKYRAFWFDALVECRQFFRL